MFGVYFSLESDCYQESLKGTLPPDSRRFVATAASSGYVLDFSNRTFEEFILDSVARNIYDARYERSDDVHAKTACRLRYPARPIRGTDRNGIWVPTGLIGVFDGTSLKAGWPTTIRNTVLSPLGPNHQKHRAVNLVPNPG
jgi:hypothetical protein